MVTRVLVLLAALALCAGCSNDPKPIPKWSQDRVSTYDGELSRYGVRVHPVEQIISYVKKHVVQPGAVIFETDGPIVIKGEEFVSKGSLFATRHPFSHTPYYTVYAVKDASSDDWVPACGVIAWPAPPPVLTTENAWISFVSLRQPED